jgi:hypothetical protein
MKRDARDKDGIVLSLTELYFVINYAAEKRMVGEIAK